MESIIEFGKILLPSALVLYAMYLGVKVMVAKELTQKQLEIRQKSIEITLPIRLQAYERMSLFLNYLINIKLLDLWGYEFKSR